jgi:hypothetical protein
LRVAFLPSCGDQQSHQYDAFSDISVVRSAQHRRSTATEPKQHLRSLRVWRALVIS